MRGWFLFEHFFMSVLAPTQSAAEADLLISNFEPNGCLMLKLLPLNEILNVVQLSRLLLTYCQVWHSRLRKINRVYLFLHR